jgi:hypothetical protein
MSWIFIYDVDDRCISIPRSVCVRSEVDRVVLDRFTLDYFGFSLVSVITPTSHTLQKVNGFLCELKYVSRDSSARNKPAP